MRRWMVIAAGVGIGLATATAWADAERPSPQLLVLGERTGAPAAPVILRGSVAQPAAAAVERGGQADIAAGRELWLVDRQSGEVQNCISRQTSSVGVREVLCTTTELGGYSRTFGPNFRP